MSTLEQQVKRAISEGKQRGLEEYEAIRRNVDAGNKHEASPRYGWVEDIARRSDLAPYRGYLEGLEEALLAVARELDRRLPG